MHYGIKVVNALWQWIKVIGSEFWVLGSGFWPLVYINYLYANGNFVNFLSGHINSELLCTAKNNEVQVYTLMEVYIVRIILLLH